MFFDTTRKLRRHEGSSCERNRRNFCTVLVACKDGEGDGGLEQLMVTESYQMNDMDCPDSMTDLRVRLCSPY